MHAWVDIAELTNTKNLNGGLVARCVAGLPFVLEEGMEVALVPPVLDAPRNVTVLFADAEGLDGGYVEFEEIDDVNIAEMVVGCHCLVRRDQLPASVSGYTANNAPDWANWEVYEQQEGYLGTVCGMREMPGQIMLEIDRQSCDVLMVPMVDEFIVGIDEDAKIITLSLPAGFLEL